MKRGCFVFAVLLLMNYLLFCQARHFLPGETQGLRDQIQTEVHNHISANQNLGMILNVDSCIGFGWNKKYLPVVEVSNPYGTLTHCVIFATDLQGYPTPTDSASGVIGVFKDGNIIWHSNGAITVKYDISSDWIWCVKDINNDGKVEILVDWREGFTQGLMNLWIVSWDGTQGHIINDRDKYGFSTIRTSGSWDFNLADVEGDGIWEIQGAMEPKHSSADTLRKIPDSDFSLYTYSWNGSLYGLWPSTPQPLYGASYPRNKAQVDVSALTRQNGNALDYNYKVHNLNSSFQFIEEFAIDRLVDTVKFNSTRNFWKGYRPFLPVIEWWSSGSYGVNYIQPGETEPSFSFTTVTPSVPKILNFYSFGINKGASSRMKRSLNNSFRGLTIGPSTPPNPFISSNFLDTLTSYTMQSRTLGWIKDQTTANKYLSYFALAETSLLQYGIDSARVRLQQVLNDVNIDSTVNLTSESYALLRYNTEYLRDNLQTSLSLSIKVFLQGPYNPSTGRMNTTLKTTGILAAHFGIIPIPAEAVDSINLEIRDSASVAQATVRKYAAAWLVADGTIRCFSDTTKSYVEFDAPIGSYYIVVHHRNHLAIMSAVKVALQPMEQDMILSRPKPMEQIPERKQWKL